ncbi:hypothetical protein CAP35_01935 [Chitinophagaceae bacterium IBVUCB1]|nr:hypothetical protein CAP35_01935 [Chitinophagaceae bacterium IBVUCB1]
MNRSAIILIFVFMLGVTFKSKCQDYIKYHQSIANAERKIFVENKIVDGLALYVKTFENYDFIFLQDCVTAMQIALMLNDENKFIVLITKGAKNGLLLRHLTAIRYINTHPIFTKQKITVIEIIKQNRQFYLRRLDTAIVKEVYSLYAWDQLEKNALLHETVPQYNLRYKNAINTTFKKFKEVIDRKGFPADKLIGIDQNDIQYELKTGRQDLKVYYYKYKKEYRVKQEQFELEEEFLASTLYFPILLHYEHQFSNYKLFNDSFFVSQIAKGNMHPKDVASIYDMEYIVYPAKIPDISKGQCFFGVGLLDTFFESHPLPTSDMIINNCRSKFFIPPIENDRLKYRFLKQHGMHAAWGWDGMRS